MPKPADGAVAHVVGIVIEAANCDEHTAVEDTEEAFARTVEAVRAGAPFLDWAVEEGAAGEAGLEGELIEKSWRVNGR
jgi:hypothetical protein